MAPYIQEWDAKGEFHREVLTKMGELGILGFADVGRVWAEGEQSDTWHNGVGGGLWLAPVKRAASLAVTFARSEAHTRMYIQAGFGF